MSPFLAAIFTTGFEVSGRGRLLLMLPLCLSIALVYKTTRCESLREIPGASLVLWVTIVLGMAAVGVGLWVLFRIMV